MTFMRLSSAESDKYDTWDRPLDVRDDTCVTVLTTLCMSMTGVHMVSTLIYTNTNLHGHLNGSQT